MAGEALTEEEEDATMMLSFGHWISYPPLSTEAPPTLLPCTESEWEADDLGFGIHGQGCMGELAVAVSCGGGGGGGVGEGRDDCVSQRR